LIFNIFLLEPVAFLLATGILSILRVVRIEAFSFSRGWILNLQFGKNQKIWFIKDWWFINDRILLSRGLDILCRIKRMKSLTGFSNWTLFFNGWIWFKRIGHVGFHR
jgi:hypothetical protein